MPVSVHEFWKLLVESRLATNEQLHPLKEKFAKVKGAETQGNSTTLSEWLVANGVVSRYQAKVLMAGRPGPFRFGDYVVYDRHSGPFKGTFKAIHPATRHQVVLSFFTGQATQNPHWWSIILQQMAVLSRALHPHLCQVYQVCDTGSYKFAVLEYVRGNSLAERLKGGALRWSDAARIVRQTAQGLVRLLEVGQLHSEVRPANIWLDRQENAKLLLPPLARDPLALPAPINFAAADPLWLTTIADYLAPELTQPGQAPSASTDVYALGCTLFELITSRTPFPGGDVRTKLRQHATSTLPSLESFDVPPLVSHVLASMTAKNPALRYQHPQLVVDALGGLLHQFDAAQLSLPPSPVPPTQAKYVAWLQQQPIVPLLPQTPAPPVAAGMDATPATAISPSQHPTPVETLAVPNELDPISAMAAAANIPREQPSFNFDDLNAPSNTSQFDHEAVFIPPVKSGESASKVTERIHNRHKQQRRILLKLAGGLLACAMVGGLAYWFTNRVQVAEQVTENTPTTDPKTDDDTVTPVSDAASSANGESQEITDEVNDLSPTVVADDGSTLWTSPTIGVPWSREYIAPAAQALLLLRPAELVKHPEGEKLLAALGPSSEIARRQLESTAGPLAEIERLTIAWVDPLTAESTGAGGWPLVPMYVVRFSAPREIDSLIALWGNAQATKEGAEQIYQTPLGTAYFPTKDERKTLVIGPAAQIKDVIQQSGKAPPLRLELEKLLEVTDDERLATLLLLPSVALRSGSEIFAGPLQNLIQPARTFLSDTSRGLELSAHLAGNSLFLELRMLNSPEAIPFMAADQAKARLAKLPQTIEQWIASLKPHEYSSLVLMRFPQMIKALEQYTRAGSEEDQSILRCYLPASAAHNLAIGTELALAENGGTASTTPPGTLAGTDAGTGETNPVLQTVAERLKQKSTLSFANETLEKALILLSDDIGVKIEILGRDLQDGGITRNMSIVGLDERDKPAHEILQNIMLKATPDGKLIYVIKPKQPGGEEMLFVTTRAAAAKRGDKLPAELAESSK